MEVQPRPKYAVIYGDSETLDNYRSQVEVLARRLRMKIKSWHSDGDGTRTVGTLDEAEGLVSALSDCLRHRAALIVPFAFDDMPGEQTSRLIGHWLYRHGLPLFLGPFRFQWERPTDEVDGALRRLLDVSHGLEAAVIARGAAPALEVLLDQITGKQECADPLPDQQEVTAPPHSAKRPGASATSMMVLRICREIDLAAGRQVPAEPDPTAPWTVRQPQIYAYAKWLQRHTSQAQIADALNSLGARPCRGGAWTPAMVSRLLRQAAPVRRRDDHLPG